MIPVIVVQMPLLTPGVTCHYCGHAINDGFVYSVEGAPYRCAECANELRVKIERLRATNEVCKSEVRQ